MKTGLQSPAAQIASISAQEKEQQATKDQEPEKTQPKRGCDTMEAGRDI
jgi:hypothetical protein